MSSVCSFVYIQHVSQLFPYVIRRAVQFSVFAPPPPINTVFLNLFHLEAQQSFRAVW
jgi:hypothetical protein